jgi:hypothetical protein
MKRMNLRRNKRGITLVALVITIIVLLILAGITISLTIGEGGIITLAQQAGKNYVQASTDEQGDLEDITYYVKEQTAEAGEKVKDLTKTTTIDGVETTEIIGQKISDGTGATIPVPTGFYYVGGTVAGGAVISNSPEDKDKYKGQKVVGTDLVGNQYVFIPCTIDGANGTLQYKRTDDGSWYIESDNDTLASKDELTLTDATCSDDDIVNGITETVLKEIVAQINAEKTSIEKYGGYYIGRYEVGIVSDAAVIKANVTPYTGIKWSKAYEIATTNISGGSYVMSYLCSSYAWDTAINFIQNNGTLNYATSRDGFNENWSDREVKDSAGNIIKASGNAIRLATGATTAKSNIFDMGGNVSEFTTELNPNTSKVVVVRGGYYYNNPPAGGRYDYCADFDNVVIGLRATLFIK